MTSGASRPSSLMLRMTVSYVAVLCILSATLGTYFYHSVRQSQEQRIESLTSGRASYYARLVHEMYSVAELHDRPLLIASMLGAERDVLVFRRPSGEVVIEVNQDEIPLPQLLPDTKGHGFAAVAFKTTTAAGTEVYWASARTTALQSNSPLEVIAGYQMTNERAMLAAYRERIILSTVAGVAAATLVAYGLLRRGLRPVHDMAAKAAEIHPGRLDLRLDPMAAPAELRALARAFNATLDRLADGYQRLSQFSADLAHEIRTPLGVLIGQTQVTLAKPRTSDEYQLVLESNLEEFERLSRLAENMLFLARADHGSQQIERTRIDMGGELQKIADYFEGPAFERNVSFSIEADGIACANLDLFRRAVSNLVFNAIRHGREGSIVRLCATSAGDQAIVEVENRGSSPSPEQLSRLFDRFYRADPSRSAATESHGLGLAIVDAIMRLHRGEAEVSCPEHDLIRFRLSFPN
ncbi:heavy metal sensor histidine kinase [Rhizobium binxianense]|uniref:heavy metal sensor histidine kinase n=1 Tax=Rhizobium binxianense TaxID=3024242 RepID=UPI00234EC3A8|nr:heavy metal sensor histidine kinase [Rhizobium sp. BC56]MDC7746561.1 heavy metal sensor histidine kinase [Rhizobium sp. BC56]